MVFTRSAGVTDGSNGETKLNEESDSEVGSKNDTQNLHERLVILENLLESQRIELSVQHKNLAAEIRNLQTRIILLEEKAEFMRHMMILHRRKLDDYEQRSRKVNLTIDGIEVGDDDTPDKILTYIMDSCESRGLNIKCCEFDRAHRMGGKYTKNGKTYQLVVLKLCSWRVRNNIYVNRMKLPFFVSANLTDARRETLNFARSELGNDPSVQRVVDYVFADDNCILKLKTNSKKYFAFSTMEEFLNIVSRLDTSIPDEAVVGDWENRIYC